MRFAKVDWGEGEKDCTPVVGVCLRGHQTTMESYQIKSKNVKNGIGVQCAIVRCVIAECIDTLCTQECVAEKNRERERDRATME